MSEAVNTIPTQIPRDPRFPFPGVELIESDGIPLENFYHVVNIVLLDDVIHVHFGERDDYYCAGNTFLYYSEEQARNRDFRGPDFFFVDGVPKHKKRRWWAIWEEEGRYPNVIVEFTSPTTTHIDYVDKKQLYEQTFETDEYFCYDIDTKNLDGWRLDANGKYQPIEPNEHGWLWSEVFGMWLGAWEGSYLDREAPYLRFYTVDGHLSPTESEATQAQAEEQAKRTERAKKRASQAKRRAEEEKRKAEEEKRRAEEEKRRAEEEKRRAEEEKRRAEDAEAEVKRLQAQLAKLKKKKK